MAYNSIISRTDTAALVPEQVSQEMLTNLQTAGSAALQLGTRIPVATNQTRFPILSALPTAYWVNGDTGLKQTSEAAWDNKYLNVEELATIIPIPEAVLDDTAFDVWGYLRPLMEEAIARALDAAIFFGASAPASFPDDIVTAAVAAGNVVARGTNDAAAGGLQGDISDLLATLEADGYMPTGSVGNVTLKAKARGTRDVNGNRINAFEDLPGDPVFALPGLWPTGLSAAELVVGAFRNMVVGVRRDMTYKLITEGVITDNSTPPQVIYNLPQQDMVALRLVFRAGWEVSNPINYQEATEANRYPFSVLRSPAA
ncbi:MAG TPA: phage major capsid protein [Nocardioidaceae bacterium]|nr:phage major capsid protein [Nocardioidaceae bacterium]